MNCENRRHSRLKCHPAAHQDELPPARSQTCCAMLAVYRSGSVTEAGTNWRCRSPPSAMRWRGCAASTSRIRCSCLAGGLHPTRLARRIAPGAMSHLRELEAELLSGESFDPPPKPRALAALAGTWARCCSCRGWRTACAARHRLPPVQRVGAGRPADRAGSDGRRPGDRHLNPQHRGVPASLFREHFVALSGRTGSRAAGVPAACSARASWQRRRWWWPTPRPPRTASTQMLPRLQISDSAMLQVRHHAAMIDLVCDSDLVAIVPQMYAQTLATAAPCACAEPLPRPALRGAHGLHRSASADPAHAWLRDCVRQLYARACGAPAAEAAEAQLRSASYPGLQFLGRFDEVGAARCSRPGTPACTAARPRRLRIRCSAAGRSRRSGRRRWIASFGHTGLQASQAVQFSTI